MMRIYINDYTKRVSGERKTCPKEDSVVEDALFNTTAFVFPYPSYHKYMWDKPQYYTSLQNANIPSSFLESYRGCSQNIRNFS